jgi:hypothetical protein
MIQTRTLIFHMTILFSGIKLLPVTLTLVFDLLFKNFNLGQNILMVSIRVLMFSITILLLNFWDLTLMFDLLFFLKCFIHGRNFQKVSIKAFIYFTCVFHVTRSFFWYQLWRHLTLWPWHLTYFWKTFNTGVTIFDICH